ncbi:MAG: hypothetical protein H0U95_11400 [Bacteroidetes bacterium]|nr:hypothetical protein [Bacteroidota bacterium]
MSFEPGTYVKFCFTGQLQQDWIMPANNQTVEILSACPIENPGFYRLKGYEKTADGNPQSFSANSLYKINNN